jgi:ERF superfamily.
MPTTETKKITKTLNESIIAIRVKLQSSTIKKSGKNKYAGFEYFELADFLPKLNELMLEEQINDIFTIENEEAKLILRKGEESQEYKIPFVMFDTPLVFKKDKNNNFVKDKNNEYIQIPSMQDIQYLGALNTYYKRYLYLNAFGITDGEIIDSMDNSDVSATTKATKTTSIDYKTMLLTELKELGLDVNSYAKEHQLSAKTTQEEAKRLLEQLKKEVVG